MGSNIVAAPKRLTKHMLRTKKECPLCQKRGDNTILINLPIILQLENLEKALFFHPIMSFWKINFLLTCLWGMNHDISFSQGLQVALTSAIWAQLGASQLSWAFILPRRAGHIQKLDLAASLLHPLAHAPATNGLLSESPTWLFTCCFSIFFPDCD